MVCVHISTHISVRSVYLTYLALLCVSVKPSFKQVHGCWMLVMMVLCFRYPMHSLSNHNSFYKLPAHITHTRKLWCYQCIPCLHKNAEHILHSLYWAVMKFWIFFSLKTCVCAAGGWLCAKLVQNPCPRRDSYIWHMNSPRCIATQCFRLLSKSSLGRMRTPHPFTQV